MSRGLVFGSCGGVGKISLTGISGELIVVSATGSAARAQHPHVTQVGGQLLSLLPAGSFAVQGSARTRLTTPEALIVSSATMMAKANRRTRVKSSTLLLIWSFQLTPFVAITPDPRATGHKCEPPSSVT
jgi:hypothetical protein